MNMKHIARVAIAVAIGVGPGVAVAAAQPASSPPASGVPASSETPTSSEVPTSSGTPTSSEVPTSSETPTSSEVPTTTGLPTTTVAADGQGLFTVNTGVGSAPLGGVTAELRACGTSDPVVATLTTRDDGNASRVLPYGCYTANVIAAPTGYAQEGGPQRSDTIAAGHDGVVTFEFRQDSGSGPTLVDGTLVKQDRITGARLAGATFEVMNCHQVPDDDRRVTTGADGTAALQLPLGCHKAVEVREPDGYQLDQTEIYFDVQAGQPYTVTALDLPIGQPPVARDPGHRVPVSAIPSGPISAP